MIRMKSSQQLLDRSLTLGQECLDSSTQQQHVNQVCRECGRLIVRVKQ